ncbi:choice-of-anchor P family protein [Nocardioides sp. MH1]|uniref:choice-of-anchor P family protein n=1 Tax=Nocardioides sp. MH1 TaxID=3242490 RepID=UPI00352235EF
MLPSHRPGISGFLAVLTGLALLVSPLAPAASARPSAPAQVATASPTDPVFHAVSGGTRINVAGVVRSELTAASSMRVVTAPRYTENKTANVNLFEGLVKAEAVSSYERTTNMLGGGIRLTSEAKIAGVSLLNGAITVDAIETKAIASIDGSGHVSRSGGTRLLGVHVKDHKIPLVVPKNFGLTIPGVAKVVINEVQGQLGGDALIKSAATGIHITLLKPRDNLSAGANIEVTPTMARILLPVPINGQPAFGFAYSSRVSAHVGDAVRIMSAPTAVVICPAGGTNGADLTNATARVRLPGLLDVQALANTANAVVTSAETDATMTAKIGAVNLLNGAITLDAVTATSRVVQYGSDPPTKTADAEILNLSINGKAIPVGVDPNTVIKIPGLVKVIINEQTELPFPYNGRAVRALHVIALPDAPDDIAGIDIELGVAAAWVNR